MIVVTGGAGFIGSNLVRALNDRGMENILIVDNLEEGPKHLNLNRCKFVDIIDEDMFLASMDEWVDEVNLVFHQGACTDTTEQNGRYMMATNYDYTKELYEWTHEHGIRLIYASSAAVYGQGQEGFRPDPRCEYPLNVYGFSKYQTDRWLRQRDAFEGSVQTVGLRYFNVYGPQENHKDRMASVIWHFFNQMKKDNEIRIFEGSEDFVRDFIYVDDVVAMNLFFMDNPDYSGIFNVGTGQPRSFLDLAKAFVSNFGDIPIKRIPFPDDLKGRYQAYTCADMTWTEHLNPSHKFLSLEDGVAKYCELLRQTGGYLL